MAAKSDYYDTNKISIDGDSGKVVDLHESWTTWNSTNNDFIKVEYGGHQLREGDFLHETSEGKLIRAKKLKKTDKSSLLQCQHELLGSFIFMNFLATPSAQTFIIRNERGFTLGSVADTPWTVQYLPSGITVEPSQTSDKTSLKQNWVNRLFLHDTDANNGHICLIFDPSGEVRPYFIDFADCFTGYLGNNYEVAMSGLGNAKKDTWGHQLIDDWTDSDVMAQLKRIEKFPLSALKVEAKAILREIKENFSLSAEERNLLERDMGKSIEILNFRKVNLRNWIIQLKPKKS